MKFCSTCKHAEFVEARYYEFIKVNGEDRCTHPEVRAWFDSLTPPNPVRPKPLVDSVDCMQARSRKDDPCGVDAKLHEEGDRVDVVARKRQVAEVGYVVRRIAAEDRKPWWRFW